MSRVACRFSGLCTTDRLDRGGPRHTRVDYDYPMPQQWVSRKFRYSFAMASVVLAEQRVRGWYLHDFCASER